MKLVKCKKCGATVMTAETLLSSMQEEYNELVSKSRRAKGADKNIINQQMAHINKMMVAVCHSTSEAEQRKTVANNYLRRLKTHVLENGLVSPELLDDIENEAREEAKRKAAEDEKRLAEIYGDFNSVLTNRTKSDPTAVKAINNIR